MTSKFLLEIRKAAIYDLIRRNVKTEWIKTLKTTKGQTQKAETKYINHINKLFNINGITYDTAPTQRSKDFRNVGGILDLEFKKTDSFNIMCNDTLPKKNDIYVILFTGKNTGRGKYKKYIPAQIIITNGKNLVGKSKSWIYDYMKHIEYIKDKWCRGDNKKNLSGPITVYTRPNISINIKRFLKF